MLDSKSLLFAAAITLLAPNFSNAQTGELPKWTADQAMLDRLGEAVEVEGYELWPPKDYEPSPNAPTPPVGKMHAWIGRARPDGGRPFVMLTLIPAPPSVPEGPEALDGVLQRLLDGVKRRSMEWEQSEFEKGTINGVTFVRSRWKATQMNKQLEGVTYAAIDGRTVIQLWSQDVVPVQDQAIDLADASIMTFRKK
jgi:hypothetical protein